MSDIAITYSPRSWQRRCHLQRKRFTVLVLHRRAGKTELAIMELIRCALEFKQEMGLFFYVAPFLKQAKAIAWARLKFKLQPIISTGAVAINESELTITIRSNGAQIRIFGADNCDAMRGVRLDGCILDEVAGMRPQVWEDVVQPTLSDRGGWALFIGTPNGINLFSEIYFKGKLLPDWHTAIYTVYDTEAIPNNEITRLKRDMSETAFAREFLCDFGASAEDQLISVADVTTASQRTYSHGDFLDAPVILGVDPARFGDDRSVIARRQGLQMFEPITRRGSDNMALAALVAGQIEIHEPDAVFIDSGAGSGVIDRLRQLGHDVIEVPFGGKAIVDSRYVNRRTEMWARTKEWIELGGAIPADPTLRQELSTPTYWFDAQGRMVLESKDEIKKRLQGGASPDLADALCLTFAQFVGKRQAREVTSRMRLSPDHEWDPYAGNE